MVIKIEQGLIDGLYQNDTYQFLGIPYAEPPINELRWKAPQTPKKRFVSCNNRGNKPF